MSYILIVIISTQFNTSIDFAEYSSQANCEAAKSITQRTLKDAVISCTPK